MHASLPGVGELTETHGQALGGDDVARHPREQVLHKLKPRDRYLDSLNSGLNDKLAERMGTDPDQVPIYLNIIFIARALERIGDHATNIGEDAFWREQAEDIRHTFGAAQEE